MVCALHQFIEEAADLAHIAGHFGDAFLGGVQFLQHHHGQEYGVFLESEQGRGIMHQDVGVQHIQPGGCDLGQAVRRDVLNAVAATTNRCDGRRRHTVPSDRSALMASSTSMTCPSTFTLRQARTSRPSGPMRKVLRSTPMTLRPYMFFP